MAPHLLPALKDALSPALTAALAHASGATHAALRSTSDTWMALLLGAVAHLATTEGGVHAVRTQLGRDTLQHSGSASAAFHAAPAADTLQPLASLGSHVLTELMGGARLGRVTLALAAVSGLSPTAAHQLACVLSAVGMHALAQALHPHLAGDDPSLLKLLRAQAADLDRQLDARLTTAAGLGSPSALLASLGHAAASSLWPGSAKRAAAGRPAGTPTSRRGWAGGLASALLTAGLAVAAASQLSTCDSRDRLADALPKGSGPAGGSGAAPGTGPNVAGPAARLSAKVFFETGQAIVGTEGQQRLATVRAWLAEEASRQVFITGYTDSAGDHELNQALAHARAQAVRRALQSAGVQADRLVMHPPESVTVGAGMSAAQARRVEIIGP